MSNIAKAVNRTSKPQAEPQRAGMMETGAGAED